MNDTAAEITQLFPVGKVVKLKGAELTVKPYGFGKYPRLLKLMKAIDIPDTVSDQDVKDMVKAAAPSPSLMRVIADNGDVAVELCMLAIDKPRAFFDDLPGDEGILLCQAILEVNADFFVARLQPTIVMMLEATVKSLGGMLSLASSPTATA